MSSVACRGATRTIGWKPGTITQKQASRLTEEFAVCLRKRTILLSDAGQIRAM